MQMPIGSWRRTSGAQGKGCVQQARVQATCQMLHESMLPLLAVAYNARLAGAPA